MRAEKQNVQEFYDTFGWQRNADGTYKDTAAFVDTRPVLDRYQRKLRQRIRKHLKQEGELFLDAGSGAIAHPEALAFSAGFRRRVCVDLSIVALTEARAKLRGRGLYVVADLSRLPFRDDVFDTTLCAHVLYHVPADEQATVIGELYRTLRPGGRAVIIYSWATSALTKLAVRLDPRRVVNKARRLLAKAGGTRGPELARSTAAASPEPAPKAQAERPSLYYHPHTYRWLQAALPADWDADVRCWRSVDRIFTQMLVGNSRTGQLLLDLIYALEDILPHQMARLGRYPMIIIRK